MLAGDDAFEAGDYAAAVQYYTRAIEVLSYNPFATFDTRFLLQSCQWNANLREKRAECYRYLGEGGKAAADLRATTKLLADPTDAYYKITIMYYQMGNVQQSLECACISSSSISVCLFSQVRECLRLNPDHKQCFPHYKKVKKLAKQIDEMNAAAQNERFACSFVAL